MPSSKFCSRTHAIDLTSFFSAKLANDGGCESGCNPNAECVTNKCKCKKEFSGDGYTCYESSCYSYPCLNSGTCRDNKGIGNFECKCLPGFSGKTCELTVLPCHGPEPDNDSADDQDTCDEQDTRHNWQDSCAAKDEGCGGGHDVKKKLRQTEKCECLEAYSGDHCENIKPKYESCASSPCLNGGKCNSNGNDDFTCTCEAEFTGFLCQERKYMSYMQFPRIHFAGRFQADVSTINNKPENYDTLNFKPTDAIRHAFGGGGGFNPTGSGNFRILDASVTRVCNKRGICDLKDQMVGAAVEDGGDRAAAKLVDFDVEMQVSGIWGLLLNVRGFFKGNFQRSSYQYLWTKIPELGWIPSFGGKYQSVLTDVWFGPNEQPRYSEVARDFKMLIGVEQKLSISFNLDMTDLDYRSANFTFGRIVGSIGILGRDSPPYAIFGRMLKPLPGVNEFYHTPFVVDNVEKKMFIDLGNSLAMDKNGNILDSVKKLGIGWYDTSSKKNDVSCSMVTIFDYLNIGDFDQEYSKTSGIYVLAPYEDEKPFVIAKVDSDNKCEKVYVVEHPTGINIQPMSRWLIRMEVGHIRKPELFVTVFGKKPKTDECNNIEVTSVGANFPPLTFNRKGSAKEDGTVTCIVCINAKEDPKNIRKTIDGQVYHLDYHYNVNGGDRCNIPNDDPQLSNSKILVLVWNKFTKPTKPTWITNIRPIFQQYANLYPVMKIHFVDLANYFDVVENKRSILKTMRLDRNHPNYMPVTRDLSPNKAEMVRDWLKIDPTPPLGSTAIQVTKETLKQLLRIALQLEHATIPPYLSGFLSIKHGQNQEVKDILRNIMIDEMFHMAQISNIMNAIGANPDVEYDSFIIPHPNYLPGGVHPHVKITIDKISIRQIQEVYMEIEKPFHELEKHGILALLKNLKGMPSTASDESTNDCKTYMDELFDNFQDAKTNHNTIGEFYTAIIWVLASLTDCGSNADIFSGDVTQLDVQYKTRKVSPVKNYSDTLDALENIVKEGEGASPCNPMDASDSTTISHYYLFSSIVQKRMVQTGFFNNAETSRKPEEKGQNRTCTGNYAYIGNEIPFYEGGVWPIVKDPNMLIYKFGSKAYTKAKTFNEMYSKLLHSLQIVFNGNVDNFDNTIGMMKPLLIYGDQLVQTPIEDDGNPEIGPNAGPTYTMK